MISLCLFLTFVCWAHGQSCIGLGGIQGACGAKDACARSGNRFEYHDTCSRGFDIVCCLRPTQCAGGGICVEKNWCSSNNGFIGGNCPGPSDVQCCIGVNGDSNPQPSPTAPPTPTFPTPAPINPTPAPVPTPRPVSNAPISDCAIHGRKGRCSTKCLAQDWYAAPECPYQGQRPNGCCLTNGGVLADPVPNPTPLVIQITDPPTPPPTPPPVVGGTACTVLGRPGTCATSCANVLEWYQNPVCGTARNIGCCLKPGTSNPVFNPTPAPAPTPVFAPTPGSTRRADLQTRCFLPNVHQSYIGKKSPVHNLALTVYVQRRFLTDSMRSQVRTATKAANDMFAAAGLKFGDVKFVQLPANLDPDNGVPRAPRSFQSCAQLDLPHGSRGCDELYLAESVYETFCKRQHVDETVVIFSQLPQNRLHGVAFGYFPWRPEKQRNGRPFGTPWLYMNIHRSTTLFSVQTFVHEFGHCFGLMHTFQTFPSDTCSNVPWSGDVIADTTATPQIFGEGRADRCRITARVPCESRPRIVDTTNRMSYGFCAVGNGFAPMTRDQFARIRCGLELHMPHLRRAGNPSTGFVAPRGGFVARKIDAFYEPTLVKLDRSYVAQVGDQLKIPLDVTLSSAEVYLYETETLEMPPKSVAEPYKVLVDELGDRFVSVSFVTYSNGVPIDRGSVMVIIDGVEKGTGVEHVFATSVFTIDVNSCRGNGTTLYGVWRTEQACYERGDEPGSVADANGLVCCQASQMLSDVADAPVTRGQQFKDPEVLMQVTWPGETAFWGTPMVITTVQPPSDGQAQDAFLMTAGQVELDTVGMQKVTFPAQGSTTVLPRIAIPGSFIYSTIDAFATRPFSVVPLPCRTKNNENGYCRPVKPITSQTATTPSDLVCLSGDYAPCADLQVDAVPFACCAGAHAYASEQAIASYVEDSIAVASDATMGGGAVDGTTITMVVVIVVVVLLLVLLVGGVAYYARNRLRNHNELPNQQF